MTNKLKEIKVIEGKIELKTGLHIGSGGNEMHIGGTDSPVIKTVKGVPYIPGSSIKGKMRSLLEWYAGAVKDGKPVSAKTASEAENKELAKDILKLFGSSADDGKTDEFGLARLSFWDCEVDEETVHQDDDIFYTEVKYENSINRINGTAISPRNIERVPAGIKFNFKLSFKVFDSDNAQLEKTVLTGMKLLEMDSLGGSGSRGYGKIKFHLSDEKLNNELGKVEPFKK
ncbi:MAG: RAMP superfamily protein [Alphaproteobacteria bacterium ADurb.Bin438]|nr:MAG: RAMP superfamily protein [Alphaproteobacteria bacterium ADurb.Bin438]